MSVPLDQFGPPMSSAELVRLEMPRAERLKDALQTAVLLLDEFGNASLAGDRMDLEAVTGALRTGDQLVIEWWLEDTAGDPASRQRARWAETFGDVDPGEVLLFEDSLGRLSIAVHEGSAADELAIGPGTIVTVARAR
jgi:S-adenosylmethionine hydrolase